MTEKLRVFAVLLNVFLLLAPLNVKADTGFYIGGGIHTNSFADDLKRGKYVDIHPGPGYQVNTGLRLFPWLALDARMGLSNQEESLSSSPVIYKWTEICPRIFFFTEARFHPFVFAGLGTYDIETTGIDFDGSGEFAGLGLEEIFHEDLSVQLYIQGSRWTGDPYDLDISSFHIGLTYNYIF